MLSWVPPPAPWGETSTLYLCKHRVATFLPPYPLMTGVTKQRSLQAIPLPVSVFHEIGK